MQWFFTLIFDIIMFMKENNFKLIEKTAYYKLLARESKLKLQEAWEGLSPEKQSEFLYLIFFEKEVVQFFSKEFLKLNKRKVKAVGKNMIKNATSAKIKKQYGS